MVGEASNGREAVQLVTKHQPDVLLLDLEMPVLNGFDTIRILSQSETATKVIVVSAYDDRNIERELLTRGGLCLFCQGQLM